MQKLLVLPKKSSFSLFLSKFPLLQCCLYKYVRQYIKIMCNTSKKAYLINLLFPTLNKELPGKWPGKHHTSTIVKLTYVTVVKDPSISD